MAKRYNGWRNYETWNIALWIGNDESLYRLARMAGSYRAFVETMRDIEQVETPDGVAYSDSGLDTRALDEMIRELGA